MKSVSTAIGTVTIEIAANRPKTTPAKSKPRPSEIRRARGVSGEGKLTAFNQINNNATPTSPRNSDRVSTSEPAASTTLLSTLQIANDAAATMPGQRSETRSGCRGSVTVLTAFRQSRWWQTVGLIVIANGPLC